MGYYTVFELAMHGEPEDIKKVEEDADACDNEIIAELVATGYVEAKWYDSYVDMKKFAKRHPNVLFVLKGDGEETFDLWEHRYKGDIDEYHKVIMPEFTTPELIIPENS